MVEILRKKQAELPVRPPQTPAVTPAPENVVSLKPRSP
jgi:hypothetical protein